MHYYSEKQTSPLRPRILDVNILGFELKFISGSGVFSTKKLDKGSEILIKNCIINEKDKILDLGCGYGVIGISIAKKYPMTQVVLTDINKRAISLSKENILLNKLDNAKAHYSNQFEKITQKFDTILLNPPQTAGKSVCFAMIEESINYLNEKGLLQLVARHQKGGKDLSKKMNNVFGNVEEIAKKAGYRVYVSKNEKTNNTRS